MVCAPAASGHFVEEEETRIAAGRHRVGAAAPAELEPARDPPLPLPLPANLPLVVVQVATIAVDETALRRLDQRAERSDRLRSGIRW